MALPVLTGGARRLGESENLLTVEGDCTCVTEVLGWILDTEEGTVTLPEKNFEDLITLVDIPTT